MNEMMKKLEERRQKIQNSDPAIVSPPIVGEFLEAMSIIHHQAKVIEGIKEFAANARGDVAVALRQALAQLDEGV